MKKIILIGLCLCLFFACGAQEQIIGTVLSELDKLPLPGATVNIKGTQVTVVTDRDGKFSASTNTQTGTILISFVGYKTYEFPYSLPLKEPLDVRLVPVTGQVSEVVISTGYQILPRERQTGSAVMVDNKLLNQQVGTDVLSRLGAVANGLTVDRSTNSDGRIMIRGLSTINGPKDPLIVVDNFPYDGDINNLNPNDVENVTILKDAAASSIWGARAGNGVIVITTKKGRFRQPVSVDFNANVSISPKPNLDYIKQMSSADFINVEQTLYKQAFYDDMINDPSMPALTPVVELLIRESNGSISAANAASQINALKKVDIRDDFRKYMYSNSVNQQYALSIAGGSDMAAWSLSGGYDKNLSNLDAGYDRKNLRFSLNLSPVKNLLVTTGLWYTGSNSVSGRPGYGQVTSLYGQYFYPYTQFADNKGNPLPVVKDYALNYIESAGNGKLLDWKYYPLTDYKHAISANNIQDIVFNGGINYRVFKGFSADVKYQYERQQTLNSQFSDQESYFTRDLINRFTQVGSGGAVTYPVPLGGIMDKGSYVLESKNIRGQLNYSNSWGDHEVAAIAGAELRSADNKGFQNRFYGYDPNTLGYGNVNLAQQYSYFIDGSYNFIPDSRDVNSTATRYVSEFANISYTFKGRYIASLSGRRDASNLFGLNTNDQWNPFWSAGGSWVLSNEQFYKSEIFPYLKLRATYGFSGNINPAMTASTTIQYSSFSNPYTQTPFALFSNYYNPDLKWETLRTINIGLDFRLAGNRLTGSIEYYQKRGSDLFGTAILDYTGGIGSQIYKNVASMTGKGTDVEIKSINLNGIVKWNTTLNFSTYRDRVDKYFLNSQRGSTFINTDGLIRVSGLEGKPVYSIFTYKWAGLDPKTGDPRGYLNGEVSKDYSALTGNATKVTDLKYMGSALPTVFGSFINSVSYKSISLNFSIIYKLGYYFRRSSINYNNLYSNWDGHADFADRWQVPGDELKTNVPSMVYPSSFNRDRFYSGSEVLVDKGDHIRLQYVNLSYDFKDGLKRKNLLGGFQVYVNASNLGIIWRANKHGIDPDYNYGSYALPQPVTIAIGLRAHLQ